MQYNKYLEMGILSDLERTLTLSTNFTLLKDIRKKDHNPFWNNLKKNEMITWKEGERIQQYLHYFPSTVWILCLKNFRLDTEEDINQLQNAHFMHVTKQIFTILKVRMWTVRYLMNNVHEWYRTIYNFSMTNIVLGG